MLDIHRRETAAPNDPPGLEFLRIELAPLIDGAILVSLTATTVDDEVPELLDQEVACVRVSTIDELLTLIRTHVRIGSAHAPSPAQQN
jgi:hypothetical protein